MLFVARRKPVRDILKPMQLERGVLTISLDFELIWGTQDLFGPERFRRACQIERAVVIDRLLDLFVEFDVQATWCVLGHLMLDRCAAENGTKHPEIIRPSHSWYRSDWFEHDPCGAEDGDSIFLGRSLIEKLRACPVPQEIGCHTFSHVIFGDEGCSRETAESELAACVEVAREIGIDMHSFAFPRNKVGHLNLLGKYGFTCYRGPEPQWYERRNLPGAVRRVARSLGVLAAAEPPVVSPEESIPGLWNIPGSMMYFPMHGVRKHIPISLRVNRAIKGLNAARRRKQIFHLWFHPTNLAYETDRMFAGLRTILEYASLLRARDELAILPMMSLVPVESMASEGLSSIAERAEC
jgi:peptidoglycan/xylan/chitin deacetylase (PgdA/CDA1 family)